MKSIVMVLIIGLASVIAISAFATNQIDFQQFTKPKPTEDMKVVEEDNSVAENIVEDENPNELGVTITIFREPVDGNKATIQYNDTNCVAYLYSWQSGAAGYACSDKEIAELNSIIRYISCQTIERDPNLISCEDLLDFSKFSDLDDTNPCCVPEDPHRFDRMMSVTEAHIWYDEHTGVHGQFYVKNTGIEVITINDVKVRGWSAQFDHVTLEPSESALIQFSFPEGSNYLSATDVGGAISLTVVADNITQVQSVLVDHG